MTTQIYKEEDYENNLVSQVTKVFVISKEIDENIRRAYKEKRYAIFSLMLKKLTKIQGKKNRGQDKASEIIGFLKKDSELNDIIIGHGQIGKVVDFGAGDGSILRELTKRLKLQKEDAIAIDPKLKEGKLDNFTILKDISELPDASVDILIAFEVFHHISGPEREAVYYHIKRVMKPNSYILVKEHDFINSEPYIKFLNMIHDMWYVYNNEESDNLYPIFDSQNVISQKLSATIVEKEMWEKGNYQRIYKALYKTHEPSTKEEDIVIEDVANMEEAVIAEYQQEKEAAIAKYKEEEAAENQEDERYRKEKTLVFLQKIPDATPVKDLYKTLFEYTNASEKSVIDAIRSSRIFTLKILTANPNLRDLVLVIHETKPGTDYSKFNIPGKFYVAPIGKDIESVTRGKHCDYISTIKLYTGKEENKCSLVSKNTESTTIVAEWTIKEDGDYSDIIHTYVKSINNGLSCSILCSEDKYIIEKICKSIIREVYCFSV